MFTVFPDEWNFPLGSKQRCSLQAADSILVHALEVQNRYGNEDATDSNGLWVLRRVKHVVSTKTCCVSEMSKVVYNLYFIDGNWWFMEE